ncbi:MAG: RHS repeat-associated core domain-containing protein, partial [Reichenbachiella sp.]
FDKDFNDITPSDAHAMVSSAAAGNASTAETISQEIEITEDGYIYLYVANETKDAQVHFDDITVSVLGFDISEMTDYYPGGSVASHWEKEPYRFGYQGQFAEQDEETGFDHFELRAYDSRINRWMIPDPAGQYPSPYMSMGNNWISRIDPDGGLDIIGMKNGVEVSRIETDDPFDLVIQEWDFANDALDMTTIGIHEKWEFSSFQGFPRPADLASGMVNSNFDDLGAILATELAVVSGVGAVGYTIQGLRTAKSVGGILKPLKNISGSLDDAARLARTQKYGKTNNIVRRLPNSVQDVHALKGAMDGKGRMIIKSLSDPRYKGWEKWHYSVGEKGSKSVVHYIRNPETGYLTDFKFK